MRRLRWTGVGWQILIHLLLGASFFGWIFLFGEHSDGEMKRISLRDPGLVALFALGILGGFALRSWWALLTMPMAITLPWVLWLISGLAEMLFGRTPMIPMSEIVIILIAFPIAFFFAFGIPTACGVVVGMSVRRTSLWLFRRIDQQWSFGSR
jgi:hypothetical protein